jgi:CubicO group peptidase (beta-lactamase class C family)
VARDPVRLGVSPERLQSFLRWLRSAGGDYWAAVVIKNGYVVFEGRGPRSHVRQRHDCGSILKPLQGTVLGAALHQKKLRSLDENALPYWKDPFLTPYENDRVITFRQFAQYHDRWNDPAPPGTFHYNNAGATAAGACIAGLFQAVRGAFPKGIAEVARREVMEKIGASWDLWYWDVPFSDRTGNPGPRMVLESSVWELAKLGYLWLRRGRWQNTRIFSEDFYREAVTDWSPETGDTRFGFFGHYGYWWFVNSKRVLLPEAPEDAFYAIGNGNPKRATNLLLIPSLDTVAVLGMERVSDEGKWDPIQNSRLPGNEGPRRWAAEVARLH